jgi:hypothetical protein
MLDFPAREGEGEGWQEAGYEFCFGILRKLNCQQLEGRKEENRDKAPFLYMY